MASEKKCLNCRHFETVKLPNESPWYFCANPETKTGPHPIGFVKVDADACSLFSDKNSAVGGVPKKAETGNAEEKSQSIFIVQAKERRPIELQLFKLAAILSTAIFLAEKIFSELPPAIREAITKLIANWFK